MVSFCLFDISQILKFSNYNISNRQDRIFRTQVFIIMPSTRIRQPRILYAYYTYYRPIFSPILLNLCSWTCLHGVLGFNISSRLQTTAMS